MDEAGLKALNGLSEKPEGLLSSIISLSEHALLLLSNSVSVVLSSSVQCNAQ